MSYLTLLKNIIATEHDMPLVPFDPPDLKLVVDNSKGDAPAPVSQRQRLTPPPRIQEENLVEVIQWRVRALAQIKQRLAGYVRGMPLSARDAEVYRRMIDERCIRLGLNLDDQQPKDLSVLSVQAVRVNSEKSALNHPQLDLSTTKQPSDSELQQGSEPTELTEGEW